MRPSKWFVVTVILIVSVAVYAGWSLYNLGRIEGLDRSRQRSIGDELTLLQREWYGREIPGQLPQAAQVPGLIQLAIAEQDKVMATLSKKPKMAYSAKLWSQAKSVAQNIAETKKLSANSKLNIMTYSTKKPGRKGAIVRNRLDLDISLDKKYGWTLSIKELG